MQEEGESQWRCLVKHSFIEAKVKGEASDWMIVLHSWRSLRENLNLYPFFEVILQNFVLEKKQRADEREEIQYGKTFKEKEGGGHSWRCLGFISFLFLILLFFCFFVTVSLLKIGPHMHTTFDFHLNFAGVLPPKFLSISPNSNLELKN